MSDRPSSLALRRFALFDDLPPARLDALAGRCVWRRVAAGQPLLLRRQPRADVYLVIDGAVRVTTYGANGRQVTFRDLGAGEIVGDLAALDGQPRSADVMTVEDSLVAVLDREAFLELLQDEPTVARRQMQRLTTLVRQLSERVIELSTLGVQNRLHAELLRLARTASPDAAAGEVRLAPAPRHAELASRISTNREQVTRELNALVRSGLLRKEGDALVVTDVARLARVVAEVMGDGGA